METLQQLAKWAKLHPLYLCIDLASAQDGLLRVTGTRTPVGAVNLFQDANTTDADKVAPWLICVPANLTEKWLKRSCQLAAETPSVTWIFSDLNIEDLSARLMRRFDVQLNDGTELLLRYFDPRILSELQTCMKPETAVEFFKFAKYWAYLNRDAELAQIENDQHTEDDNFVAPHILHSDEEHALLLASEAAQTLNETLSRWPDDLNQLKPQARFNLAKTCCLQCDALGLDNLADKVLLLMLAAGEKLNYFESPAWMTHTKALQDKSVTLKQLLEATLDPV
jgi:hypothetical protein